MKKLLTTSMLTLTLTMSTLFGGSISTFGVESTAVASAATIGCNTVSVPSLCINSRTADTATLNIGKVKGADCYKVYRASSKDGAYKCIATTTNCTFKDTDLSAGKNYCYKVKAVKKVNGANVSSKCSTKVTTPTTKKSTKTSTSTKTNTSTKTTSNQTYDSSFASQVLKLVNQERVKGGLSELTMSSALTAPANKRAQEIKQSFSHTRPNGSAWSTVLDEYNVSVSTAGENLAYGYNTPEAVVTGWMNSPGHRANIMNGKFHKIGIGVYKDSNGTVYCTQLFSN
jgi:uncharacterized protein YkwD